MRRVKKKGSPKTLEYMSNQPHIYVLVHNGEWWEVREYAYAREYGDYGEPLVWNFHDEDGCFYKEKITSTTNLYIKSWSFLKEVLENRADILNRKQF